MERVFFYIVTDFFTFREESIYNALRMYEESKEFWPGDRAAVYRSPNSTFNKEESELIVAYLYLPTEV